jgi:hypothetical protein
MTLGQRQVGTRRARVMRPCAGALGAGLRRAQVGPVGGRASALPAQLGTGGGWGSAMPAWLGAGGGLGARLLRRVPTGPDTWDLRGPRGLHRRGVQHLFSM